MLSSKPPVVNYLMVSYQWNFFAETALRSLPDGIDVYVIHNSKTKGLIDRFNQSRVRKQWCVHGMQHGAVLDAVWSSSRLREIRECDVLIMLDHDCYFGEPFKEMEKQLIDAIVSGYLIAGSTVDFQYFPTSPVFAVKPIEHWPTSWLPNYGTKVFDKQEGTCNTGQHIAKLLPHGSIRNFDEPRFLLHWSNIFRCFDEANFNARMHEKAMIRYEYLLCSGKWSPNQEELEAMSKYPMLQRAVRWHRAKHFGT